MRITSRPTLSNLIVELLKKHHLLSAPEILSLLKDDGLKYNKTSVYRALDKLFINQKICRHSMGSNQIVYALRCGNKANLVCQCCGKVQTIDISSECDISFYQTENFTPDHPHVTNCGRCHKCSEDGQPNRLINLHI